MTFCTGRCWEGLCSRGLTEILGEIGGKSCQGKTFDKQIGHETQFPKWFWIILVSYLHCFMLFYDALVVGILFLGVNTPNDSQWFNAMGRVRHLVTCFRSLQQLLMTSITWFFQGSSYAINVLVYCHIWLTFTFCSVIRPHPWVKWCVCWRMPMPFWPRRSRCEAWEGLASFKETDGIPPGTFSAPFHETIWETQEHRILVIMRECRWSIDQLKPSLLQKLTRRWVDRWTGGVGVMCRSIQPLKKPSGGWILWTFQRPNWKGGRVGVGTYWNLPLQWKDLLPVGGNRGFGGPWWWWPLGGPDYPLPRLNENDELKKSRL